MQSWWSVIPFLVLFELLIAYKIEYEIWTELKVNGLATASVCQGFPDPGVSKLDT